MSVVTGPKKYRKKILNDSSLLLVTTMSIYLFFKSIYLLKYAGKEDLTYKVIYSIIISSAAMIPIFIAFPSLVYFPISLILGLNFAFLSNISLRLESKN